MKIDLTGKHAVVTGSTAGIGFAIAKGLAASGASVVVNGRTDAKVKQAVEALKKELPSAKVEGVAADLATADGANAFVQRVPQADILVNNLGIFEPKNFEDIPDEDWLRLFETNVMSGIRMSRAYIPGMKAKDWGRIVFISSESGLNIPLEMIHYGMTKTAQIAVARGLAESLAGTGVTVNSLLPGGACDTDPNRPPNPHLKLLPVDIMNSAMVWLASKRSDGKTGGRYIGRLWDDRLPPDQAAAGAMTLPVFRAGD